MRFIVATVAAPQVIDLDQIPSSVHHGGQAEIRSVLPAAAGHPPTSISEQQAAIESISQPGMEERGQQMMRQQQYMDLTAEGNVKVRYFIIIL